MGDLKGLPAGEPKPKKRIRNSRTPMQIAESIANQLEALGSEDVVKVAAHLRVECLSLFVPDSKN